MADNKKSFVLYTDMIHTVSKMPKGKQAELFMTILKYVNDENPKVDDLIVSLVWEPIKLQLKRDLLKYKGFCKKQSENGQKGGRPPSEKETQINPNNPSLFLETQKSLTVNDNVNDNVTKDAEPSETEIEYQITQMIVPNILKVWKDKNPKYFSHLETDSHAALQIAYNIAADNGWKKAAILKYKENECVEEFTKIAVCIMAHKFWSSKTLEMIAKPNNWQKIVNEMVERTQEPFPNVVTQMKPKYNIEEQLKKYG